ncbi:MAG: SRPBCC domain-containing protein [Chloroflexi bacterium]|nr:SRPBCC domain-containing protein [Chloroflexota bacterium]
MAQEASGEIVIERVFDAPRELVWKAWTDPEHVAQWWGPQGMTTRVDELDLRPGGNWRYVMLHPNGSEYPQKGTFREIVAPEKIVTSAEFEVTGDHTQHVIMMYQFDELGDKTKFTMRHEQITPMDPSYKEGVAGGWNSNFDCLVDYLPTLAPTG